MSIVKKLAGETLIYGLGAILPKVLNFLILGFYLTRVLSTGDYGIHAIVYAFVAMMMVITTFRMETAFFRFASKKENTLSETFTTAFISVLILSLVSFISLLVFSQSIAAWLNIPEHPEYIKYFAWIILFDSLTAPAFARLRMENRVIYFSILKIINVVINILLIIFFIEICPILNESNSPIVNWFYQPTMQLDYVFYSNMGASAIIFILLSKEILKDKFIFNKQLFVGMVKYAAPLIIVGVAYVINNFSDRFLLSELLPGTLVENTEMAGIYTGSTKIAVLMSLFITAFNYAAEPFFFKHSENNKKDNAYANIALAFSAAGGLIFLGVLLFMDIIQYLIGKDFREALDIVPILLLAYLFLGLFYNFSIWYKLTDKTYFGAIIASLGSVILLSFSFYLIPTIGYMGAAWSILYCYIFMAVAIYVLGQKYHPIPYPIIKILFNILLAIGLFFLSKYINELHDLTFLKYTINLGILCIYIGIIYKYQWDEIKQ